MFVVSNVISVLEIWRGRERERARAREAESERHRKRTLCYKHNTPTRDNFCTIWKLALRHEAESERHLLVYEAFRY